MNLRYGLTVRKAPKPNLSHPLPPPTSIKLDFKLPAFADARVADLAALKLEAIESIEVSATKPPTIMQESNV